MKFYDGYSICGKVETHNSPSAIEPYGGAMTGSGGVFRDILGTGRGAKTIASTDMFCFAKPNLLNKDLPEGCLPPEYLLKRVVAGVRDYGNRMGIPTNNGSVHFHDDFRAKPTVIVGAYGIIPTKLAQKGKPKNGDLIIAVGSRTGRTRTTRPSLANKRCI
jgi:phosphoribosylformylglycinamidine synthase